MWPHHVSLSAWYLDQRSMLNVLLTAVSLFLMLSSSRKMISLPFSLLDKSHKKIKIGRPISRNSKKRYCGFFFQGFLIHLLLHTKLRLEAISLFIPIVVHKTKVISRRKWEKSFSRHDRPILSSNGKVKKF